MSAKKGSTGGRESRQGDAAGSPADPAVRSPDDGGPESVEPWGWGGDTARDAPWGVGEDSPMNEGSEVPAVAEGRRGERRAGPDGHQRRGLLPPVEPTRVPEAGPGAPPDPGPPPRTFPEDSADGDLPTNPTQQQTGMHPEGVSRRSRR